jgi:hypothetical protein
MEISAPIFAPKFFPSMFSLTVDVQRNTLCPGSQSDMAPLEQDRGMPASRPLTAVADRQHNLRFVPDVFEAGYRSDDKTANNLVGIR